MKKGISTAAKVAGGIAGLVFLLAPTLSYDGLILTGVALAVSVVLFVVAQLLGDSGPDDKKLR
jgi:hypothetical protein